MTVQDDLLRHLTEAQTHITAAMTLVETPTSADEMAVAPGDNLLSMIEQYPPGTTFRMADGFMQDVGITTIRKPTTIIGGTLTGAITCGAEDIRFMGVTLNGQGQTLLTTGLRTVVETCILTGHPNGQHRGIAVNSEGVRIRNTRVVNIFKDIDTQAISGWTGTKDLEISHCELEASGENILFGGADSASEAAMPRDILIEDCRLWKNPDWAPDPRAVCKNLFELKAVDDLTIKNCTMEYSPVDGQTGFGVVLTVRNQSGSAPWTTISNVLMEGNTIRHTAAGVQVLGRDDIHASGIMTNVTLRNNIFEHIDPQTWGTNGREFQISGGPTNLTLDGNTFTSEQVLNGLYFDQPQYPLQGLVLRNNFFIEGRYGIFGSGAPGLGKVVLDTYAPGYVWAENRVKKSGVRNITWPPGTIFVES